jgi:aminoglycoside 6-adenylyltransferase
VPADEWSDLDVVIIADDPPALLARDDWARGFGPLVLTFLEPTALRNGWERRALYEDGTDVDFSVVPLEVVHAPDAREVAARGIRVLLDKDGELTQLVETLRPPPPPAPPGTAELRELADDFFYHAVWAARKLRRGEVFTGKGAVDGYMKRLLLRLLEWHARARDPAADAWHEGRFLERWADPDALAELRLAYAHYDADDVRRALLATMALFRRVALETAALLVLEYPERDDAFASRLVHELLG